MRSRKMSSTANSSSRRRCGRFSIAISILRATIRAIVAELRAARVHGVEFSLIVDVTRNFGAESAMRTAQLAASLAGEGVIGIGLGGDEDEISARAFRRRLRVRARAGICTRSPTPAKAAGAQSVRAAVEIGAERIGHGVRALEDPSVVALLRERAIALEISPTSNARTGVGPARRGASVARISTRAACASRSMPTIRRSSAPRFRQNMRWSRGVRDWRRCSASSRNAADASFLVPRPRPRCTSASAWNIATRPEVLGWDVRT